MVSGMEGEGRQFSVEWPGCKSLEVKVQMLEFRGQAFLAESMAHAETEIGCMPGAGGGSCEEPVAFRDGEQGAVGDEVREMVGPGVRGLGVTLGT